MALCQLLRVTEGQLSGMKDVTTDGPVATRDSGLPRSLCVKAAGSSGRPGLGRRLPPRGSWACYPWAALQGPGIAAREVCGCGDGASLVPPAVSLICGAHAVEYRMPSSVSSIASHAQSSPPSGPPGHSLPCPPEGSPGQGWAPGLLRSRPLTASWIHRWGQPEGAWHGVSG